MARIETSYFGEVSYSREAVIEFPHGISGFEKEHVFVLLKQSATHFLMFMQSLSRPDLGFILLPVLAAGPHYKLRLADEDLADLGLAAGAQPRIGKDLLCAVPVRAAHGARPEPTVSLLAPILVNLKRQIGVSDAVRILLPTAADLSAPSESTRRGLIMSRRAEGFFIGEAIEIAVKTIWGARDIPRTVAPESFALQRKIARITGDVSFSRQRNVRRQEVSPFVREMALRAGAAPVNPVTAPLCN